MQYRIYNNKEVASKYYPNKYEAWKVCIENGWVIEVGGALWLVPCFEIREFDDTCLTTVV